MYYFVEVACVIFEMWLINLLLSSFFHKKMLSMWKLIISYVILGGIVTIFSLAEIMPLVRMSIIIFGMAIVGVFVFGVNPLHGFLAGFAFTAIAAVSDIISAYPFQLVGVTLEALMKDHFMRSLYLIAAHIMMFGAVMLVCVINGKRRSDYLVKILIPVVPCWIVSIALCLLISWQCFVKEYELHPGFIVVLLGMLYTNIVVIYHTNRISDQAQIKKDWEIAEHHYAMQQDYYDQLRIQQEETRALWHDISKYLRASRVEGSSDALEQVQDMLDSISCVVDVNNRIISVILNEYYQICRHEDIALHIDVKVPAELFVTAADLYVLIGNTLDNAIEACKDLPVDKRAIHIMIKTHNDILYYEVTNNTAEMGSTRIRSKHRGYGLKNVRRCAEKYGGKVEIFQSDSHFRLAAHLNKS